MEIYLSETGLYLLVSVFVRRIAMGVIIQQLIHNQIDWVVGPERNVFSVRTSSLTE